MSASRLPRLGRLSGPSSIRWIRPDGAGDGGSDRGRRLLPRSDGPDPVRRARPDRPPCLSASTTLIGSSWASGWRTTSGSRSACGTRSTGRRVRHVRRRDARPAVARSRRRSDDRGAPEAGRRVRVPREARRARTTASTTETSRPKGDLRARSATTWTPWSTTRSATRSGPARQLLWGTANLFTHPRYEAGAATNPDPEVFAYAAAQVKPMLEATQRLGGDELRPVGRPRGLRDAPQHRPRVARSDQLARFLAIVAEHKHRIGFKGTLLIEPKPMEPTKHQYDYDVGDDPRLPRPPRAGGRVPAQHRGQPRDARRPQLPPRGRLRGRGRDLRQRSTPTAATPRTAGTPTSSRTRSKTWRCRSTRSCSGGGFTTGGFNFDAKLRRQSIGPDRPVPRPHRRDRHARPGAARRRRARSSGGRCREPLAERYAGWSGALGTAILGGRRDARVAGRQGRVRRDRSDAGVGPPGAARERRQSGDLDRRPGSRSDPAIPLRRPTGRWPTSSGSTTSTTATKAVLIDEAGTVVGVGSGRVRVRRAAAALERAGARQLWWDGAIAAIRSVLASTGRRGRRRRGDRADRPDARRSSCSTPRTRSSARRSSGTTSEPPPSATRSARPSGRSG